MIFKLYSNLFIIVIYFPVPLYRNDDDYKIVHYLLVVFAYFGFLFFDLLYIAVTINYCSQCQLLTFYIDNIQDKVRNKKYDNLNLAIKVGSTRQ